MVFREACMEFCAFGVPPLLLGLPGDNTYANYQEANRAFWRQTVIPLVARIQKSFAAWLSPAYGAFSFDYDIDRLDALADERTKEWSRIGAASFLSDDEKREAVGYGPRGVKEDSGDGVDVAAPAGEPGADGEGGGSGPGGNNYAYLTQPRDERGQWTKVDGQDPIITVANDDRLPKDALVPVVVTKEDGTPLTNPNAS